MSIELALQKLREHGQIREAPFPIPSDATLAEAEQKLGAKFPPSYKRFLKDTTSYGLIFEEFLWPGSDRDLVVSNLERRAEAGGIHLPKYLIAFLQDGYGNDFCFDTRNPDANGEYPIVEWEMGWMEDQVEDDEIEPIAVNFALWLIDTIDYEKEEQARIEDET